MNRFRLEGEMVMSIVFGSSRIRRAVGVAMVTVVRRPEMSGRSCPELVVTLRRYIMPIYIARVSTSSYVEDWYIEIISYMRYMSIFHVRFM